MAPGKSQVPIESRAAVITMKMEGRGWTYISRKLENVSPNGAQTLWQTTLTRSGCDPNNPHLPTLLLYIHDLPRSGRPERFPEESCEADTIVQLATADEIAQDRPHIAVAQLAEDLLGIRIPYTTCRDVLKKREIVKTVPPRKIKLDEDHQLTRWLFCEWALGELQLRAVFIFSDETLVENNHHRKRPKISRLKGSNPFDYARPPADTFKAVMFWGVICSGFEAGPFHVWEKETEAEKQLNERLMALENQVS